MENRIQGAETLSTDANTGVHIYRKENIIFLMIGTVIIPLDAKMFLSFAEQVVNVMGVVEAGLHHNEK